MNNTNENFQKAILLLKEQKFTESEKIIEIFVKNYPENIIYKNLLSIIYASQKKYSEAERILKKILNNNPNNFDANLNLGTMFLEIFKYKYSEIYIRKACLLNKENNNAQLTLAKLYDQTERYKKSEIIYENLILRNPNNIDLLINYSTNQIKLGKIRNAKLILKKVQLIDKFNISALINLGVISKEKKEIKKAKEYFYQAINIFPNHNIAIFNLAVLEYENNNINNAISLFKKAIKFNPNYYEAYFNLGKAYQELGKFSKSKIFYENSIEINGAYSEAIYNLSRLNLFLGNFKKGWEGYKIKEETTDSYRILGIEKKSIWDGQPFVGKLFIHGEEGIGDEIMFSSLFNEAYLLHSDLIISCEKRLFSIFKRSFPKINFITRGKKNYSKEIKKHYLADNLGILFRKSIDEFKHQKKYWLIPSKVEINKIKKLLPNNNKIRVGFSWKSSGKKLLSKDISLHNITKAFPKEKFELINLQYGNIEKDVEYLRKKEKKHFLLLNDFDYKNNIEGLAALISLCDMVVTIDNFTASLSGSLGINTWVYVTYYSQWRWTFKRKNSLWYPSVKIFRQKKIK